MPSLLPCRMPAWLALVWLGSRAFHSVRRWDPERSIFDITGARPAWSCCLRTSWLSPSIWMRTSPGSVGWMASSRCMRRRRTRAPKCESSSEIEKTAVRIVFATAKTHDPMKAAVKPSISTPGTIGPSANTISTWRISDSATTRAVEMGAARAKITGRTSRFRAQRTITARAAESASRMWMPGTRVISERLMNATTNETVVRRTSARGPGRQRTTRSIWIR